MKKIKEVLFDNFPGLYLILTVSRRVMKRDKDYIWKIFNIDSNPAYLKMIENGKENEGEIVFLIQDLDKSVGFCAVMVDTIRKLIYAEEKGLKPYIKYSSNFLYFDSDKNIEKQNPFEYYYKNVGEEKDYFSQNLVMAEPFHGDYIRKRYCIDAWEVKNYYNAKMIDSKCRSVINKYFRIEEDILQEIHAFFSQIVGKKILGIHYRGTDYKVGYNMHPVQIERNQFLSIALERINNDGYDAIFLATDDSEICSWFLENLGEHVYFYQDVTRSAGSVSVAFSEDNRKYHHYLLGKEILRDMYTLSMCDGLLAGKSHVSYLATLFKASRKERYSNLDILDRGNHVNNQNFYDTVEVGNLK